MNLDLPALLLIGIRNKVLKTIKYEMLRYSSVRTEILRGVHKNMWELKYLSVYRLV